MSLPVTSRKASRMVLQHCTSTAAKSTIEFLPSVQYHCAGTYGLPELGLLLKPKIRIVILLLLQETPELHESVS